MMGTLPVCNDGAPNGGHGTKVAGIAAAKDNNIGVVGTAPGARIWALKVFPDSLNCDESDVIEALNYVAAHANEIEVVNLSLRHISFSFPYFVATAILLC
jgi:subtilisin family serine protease